MLIGHIVRRPVTALIVVVLAVLFGIFTSTQLSLDFFPDVESAEVMIFTNYPGASPEEVEKSITKPLEETIRGIANFKDISSTSREGNSVIRISFKYGTGIDQNVNNLRERIDRIRRQLPENVGDPTIFRFSTNDIPIMTIAVVSNRSVDETKVYFDDKLLSYFEQINGVANIEVNGGQSKQVFVEPSIDRLNAFNLTLADISKAISSNGQRTNVGTISTDVSDVGLVVDNNYKNLEELKNLIVVKRTTEFGEPYYIRLRDIADITFGYDKLTSITSLNDRAGILLNIYKLSNSNIVKVADNVKNMLKQIKDIAPEDFEFVIVDDQSEFIRDNLKVVGQAMGSGALLAIIVLLIFLRNFTSVLVVMISMPISLILTFMLMYFANMSINFMTLAGLALGIGMLVDNSIVVLENIYNKRLRGVKLLSASEYGATEMSRPILASTLTTVLVFTPLILFKNELESIGGFFSALVFTVVISVVASYFVAAFFLPVLTSKYLPIYRAQPKGLLKFLDTKIENFFEKLNNAYHRAISFTVKRPKRFILLILVIALLPFLAITKLNFSFIPEFTPEEIDAVFNFPSNTKLEDMQAIVSDFESRILYLFDGVGIKFKTTDIRGRNAGSGLFSRNSRATLAFYYRNITQKKHEKIRQELLNYRYIYPGVNIRISEGHQRGPGGGVAAFNLQLKSNDYDKLLNTVSIFSRLIKENNPNLTNIESTQDDSSLEYAVRVNLARANSYGLNVSQIVQELSTAVQGLQVGKFNQEADEYNIRLRLNNIDRARSDLTERLYINTPSGTRIPLDNVLNKNFDQSLTQIERKSFQRTITITGDLVGKYSATQAVRDVKRLLSAYPLDEDVTYIFEGEYKDITKNFSILLWIFLLAVLFVYGIMAGQFESFLDPFIIIFTVPLTFAGVLGIYFITGNNISSFTIVGIIMLVGIAVNHGIVLVDYINLLRKRGVPLDTAVIEGSKSRLQPILMTSLTTIFGLVPTTLMSSNGVSLVKPLALTVVGGLSASAFLSLFFIPLIYKNFHSRLHKVSNKRKLKLARKEEYTVLNAKENSEFVNSIKMAHKNSNDSHNETNL